MKCTHEYTSKKYDCDGLPDPLEMETLECLDCGALLSLGPSNDTLHHGELGLAKEIQEAHWLWERGKGRTRAIEFAIKWWSERTYP